METVEVVIKLPKKEYDYMIANPTRYNVCDDETLLYNHIKNGAVLPKGHGRIIDESKINKCEQAGLIMKNGDIVRCLVTDAPTIIEKARDKE